jgi:hypothetical protein
MWRASITRGRAALSQRFASTLVIAEHADGALSQNTLAAVTAAQALGQPIRGVVVGGDVKKVADAFAKVAGVAAVDVISSDKLTNLEAERVVSVLQQYVVSFLCNTFAKLFFNTRVLPYFFVFCEIAEERRL